MKSMHIRLMLQKIDKKKYNLTPTLNELKELERLSDIGKALTIIMEKGYILTYSIGKHSEIHDINTIDELLELKY